MSYLSERVSYLKGLAAGLKISETTKEGELLLAMLEVLDDIVDEVNASTEAQDELFDMFDELEDSQDDCDCCDDDCDCDCDECGDMDYFEIQCENCGNTIYLDEDLLANETEFECPVCKEKIEVELEECDCDDDCDCDDCE